MKALLGAHLPKLVFVLALVPGMAMTAAVHYAGVRRSAVEFERLADQAMDRVVTRLEQHVVVLRAARGLLSAAGGGVSREEFVRFLSSVDIVNELGGVQGIGFARLVAKADADLAQAEILQKYGVTVPIRPETDQAWRTPIVLLEPANDRNMAALGYDMYAEPVRRSAMERAIASGDAQMSGPVELVQEITKDKQTGFLIYLPFRAADPSPAGSAAAVAGFVYAPFRGGDLIRAALAVGSDLPVAMRIADAAAVDRPLFNSIDPDLQEASPQQLTRSVEMLGRQWRFDFAGTEGIGNPFRYLDSVVLGLTSLLFAAAAAYAMAARQDEAIQARAVAAAAARESEYRGLLLQEMKHRIKNHIARIQSIARQSARGATDVKAFTSAFDARLQAMSAVQEILAGTAAPQADVRAILTKELQQCLDTAEVDHLLDGPPVTLDERQAHAFALVAHELVTNAMKYGGLSATGAGLKVTWALSTPQHGVAPRIDFTWEERMGGTDAPSPSASGFGSRLIEASLKGELSGSIKREFQPGGLTIAFGFPVSAALNSR